jgi:(1->4)-alpha-D-glucan 1-alpha-D-glucosylmutase
VPDFYQGTEYWDLSLVDPDNRSPVDFAARQKSLRSSASSELITHWQDGGIKQDVISRTLALRKKLPALFSDGNYLPLETDGPLANHVIAYARVHGNSIALVAACRSAAKLLEAAPSLTIAPSRWRGTQIRVPSALQTEFSDVLQHPRTVRGAETIAAEQVFAGLPVALLVKSSH